MQKVIETLEDLNTFMSDQNEEIKELIVSYNYFETISISELKYVEKITLKNCESWEGTVEIKSNIVLKEISFEEAVILENINISECKNLEKIIFKNTLCSIHGYNSPYIGIKNINIDCRRKVDIYLNEFEKKVVNFESNNENNLNFIILEINGKAIISKFGYYYDQRNDIDTILSLKKIDKYLLLSIYLAAKSEYYEEGFEDIEDDEDEQITYQKNLITRLENKLINKEYYSDSQKDIFYYYLSEWSKSFDELEQYLPETLRIEIQKEVKIENLLGMYDKISGQICYNGHPIVGVDEKTFEIFQTFEYVSPYSKDKNNIYFQNKIFKNCDYDNFELFIFPFLRFEYYCFDKNNIYDQYGNIVTEIDGRNIANINLKLGMQELFPFFSEYHKEVQQKYDIILIKESEKLDEDEDKTKEMSGFGIIGDMINKSLKKSENEDYDFENFEDEVNNFENDIENMRNEKDYKAFLDYMARMKKEYGKEITL